MTEFTHDLAFSAVSYDAMLVTELSSRLAPSLSTAPYWRDTALSVGGGVADVVPQSDEFKQSSRLALVLHQRLWAHDRAVRVEEAALRQRASRDPRSIRVVTLDDSPLPDWLAPVPSCAWSDTGFEGVIDFALDAVDSCGGSTRRQTQPAAEQAVTAPRWADGPQPYLRQPRAQSSLRRELDAVAAALEPRIRSEREHRADPATQSHNSPNRFVVQLGEIGLSFSWMPGRSSSVEDGRLLVIEWKGVVTHARRQGAIQTATVLREVLYRPEAHGADDWCWRVDGPVGAGYSSANLAGQWFATAQLDSGELALR